ncbi:hypothetical protein SAMN05421869_101175 [Nonomuraea jiangxiensis]|uniref:Uncharacterized protein n=1 Tax=Nonomuraea jiangxiensis TaxID=633440 RepID=A0A1G7YNZ1_9ACTN|nr:hypothetical protein SAMN05421869_101175 [Nonomuraea jiangxiensis]
MISACHTSIRSSTSRRIRPISSHPEIAVGLSPAAPIAMTSPFHNEGISSLRGWACNTPPL